MKISTLILLSLVSCFAYGIESQTNDVKKGWHWYEIIPEKVEPEESEKDNLRKPLPQLPERAKMMDMHPEEIREMLTKYHEQAIWRPTAENVKNYLRVQDVMQKKAVAMSAAQAFVMMTSPELNTAKEYPLNKVGMDDYRSARKNEIGSQLSKYRDKYGMIFFVEKSCTFCGTQHTILQSFADRHGWNVAIIDIKENPSVALRFSVEYTPQIIIAKRNTKKWMSVAVGVEPIVQLEENTYRAVRSMENNSTPDQFYTMDFEEHNRTPRKIGSQ